jgi:hypothetical protein
MLTNEHCAGCKVFCSETELAFGILVINSKHNRIQDLQLNEALKK